MIPSALTRSGAFVLRKFGGTLAGAPLIATARSSSGARERPSLLATTLSVCAFLLLPILVLAVIGLALHGAHSPLGALVATAPAIVTPPTNGNGKKPANIRQMEADFKRLATELELAQTEMANGRITQKRGDEISAMAKEMEELQEHLDQYNTIAGITKKAREVQSPTLPTDRNGNVKRVRTTPGDFFIRSDAFQRYVQQGKQNWSAFVELKSRLGKRLTLSGEQAVEFEAKAFSSGQLSDLGSDAFIEIDRDREVVRFEEPEVLTIRDVLNQSTTTSDSIRYVKHTATDRAADVQASRGAAKSYLTITMEPTDVSTSTIAVLAKVTEQDVDDAPRLVSYINGEMALDVKVKEEDQLLWGTGNAGQIKGLFTEDIPEFDRAATDDTIIDVIRKMRTDLRKRHVTPTFVAIDPIDWETVELLKANTDQYIWGLITDLRGPRIWSLRVVESDAMTHTSTGHRRILMGDGIRGATIYDRHDVRLAIGYVDDDFARNLRTLRAEERLALAVKRPWAFEYAVTSGPQGAAS